MVKKTRSGKKLEQTNDLPIIDSADEDQDMTDELPVKKKSVKKPKAKKEDKHQPKEAELHLTSQVTSNQFTVVETSSSDILHWDEKELLRPDKRINPSKLSKRTQRIYKKYEDQLMKMNMMDFEQMETDNPLGNFKELLAKDQNLIDHFQRDTKRAIADEKEKVKENQLIKKGKPEVATN